MEDIDYNTLFDLEEVKQLYASGLSGIEIAVKLNSKPSLVYRFMIFHKIERRTGTEAQKNSYRKGRVKSKNKKLKKSQLNYAKVKVK